MIYQYQKSSNLKNLLEDGPVKVGQQNGNGNNGEYGGNTPTNKDNFAWLVPLLQDLYTEEMKNGDLNGDYSKTGHWIWYVFPTSKIGANDTHQLSVDSVNAAVNLLKIPRLLTIWTSILQFLTTHLQRETSPFSDQNDINRIRYYLTEWDKYIHQIFYLSPTLDQLISSGEFGQFLHAFDEFKEAFNNKHNSQHS